MPRTRGRHRATSPRSPLSDRLRPRVMTAAAAGMAVWVLLPPVGVAPDGSGGSSPGMPPTSVVAPPVTAGPPAPVGPGVVRVLPVSEETPGGGDGETGAGERAGDSGERGREESRRDRDDQDDQDRRERGGPDRHDRDGDRPGRCT